MIEGSLTDAVRGDVVVAGFVSATEDRVGIILGEGGDRVVNLQLPRPDLAAFEA